LDAVGQTRREVVSRSRGREVSMSSGLERNRRVASYRHSLLP